MKKKVEHVVWPNAVSTSATEGASRLISWIFETWNEHANSDDRSLRNQFRRRAGVLRSVEQAIQQYQYTDEQKMAYRERLLKDMAKPKR